MTSLPAAASSGAMDDNTERPAALRLPGTLPVALPNRGFPGVSRPRRSWL